MALERKEGGRFHPSVPVSPRTDIQTVLVDGKYYNVEEQKNRFEELNMMLGLELELELVARKPSRLARMWLAD